MNAKFALVRPSYVSDTDPLAALYITRLSIRIATAATCINDSIFSDDIRKLIGIEPLEGTIPKTELRILLRARLPEVEHAASESDSVLTQNVEMLSDLLTLSALEQQILSFTALTQHHTLLHEVVTTAPLMGKECLIDFLADALNIDHDLVQHVLKPTSPLIATRILNIETQPGEPGFQLSVPKSLTNALFVHADDINALMRALLEPSPPATLGKHEFQYLNSETALLSAYVANACTERTTGINILIYGPPGTGKTEYARWLASLLKKKLFQVRATDDADQSISGLDRLSFFQLSQRFLQNSDAIMLFDEIEDVFPASDPFGAAFGGVRQVTGKLFMNRVLESNPVPAIWISNTISHIDKAYLRRFDYSFEMSIPPASVRRRIIERHLQPFKLPEKTTAFLTQQDKLSAAQIEKIAKILHLTNFKSAAKRTSAALQIVENSMSLLEQPNADQSVSADDYTYALEHLNASHDLNALLVALKQSTERCGAMCFFGPPGTGKTALAHHIAREIEQPILAQRASDILSPYVGETEQKIAQMFKRAQQNGAVLLLDEADSFLSTRLAAKNAWEVTAVNELLVQMERFDGLFICSTNLMQALDIAALRRFALKIKFDYLSKEQRWALFLTQVGKRPTAQRCETLRNELDKLNTLTPGDFATVRRAARLYRAKLSADELLCRLIEECRLKRTDGASGIGFVRTY